MDHLADGFAYSLDDLDSGHAEPIDHFLFEARKGHCEYFATALTILLRCAGVHARVVEGFVPGTFMDGKYVVRLSDAHLWTDVFYPGQGWKSFDPTPGNEERLLTPRHVGFADKLALRWQIYVLQYDGAAQADIVNRVKSVSVTAAKGTVAKLRSSAAWLTPGLLALVLLFILIRLGRRRWRWAALPTPAGHRRRGRAERVRSQFGRYLKELARRGYKRSPGTTPNDLLDALARDRAPILDQARLLTRLFYDARFGGAHVSAETAKAAKCALKSIRTWTR